MSLTLITCTGGRPAAFALCERWLAQQTYRGPLQWLVIDDCDPATACTMGQTVIRPEPRWKPGENTLARNILAALPHVKHDKIVFVEDDDWIFPSYLELADTTLAPKVHLIGDTPARYYNVATRQYHYFGNRHHASLGQTALTSEMVPALRRVCESGGEYIDLRLWRQFGSAGAVLSLGHVVGIKGLPGRPGIGVGHRPRFWWPRDSDGAVLRSWIGDDAVEYGRFCERKAA